MADGLEQLLVSGTSANESLLATVWLAAEAVSVYQLTNRASYSATQIRD